MRANPFSRLHWSMLLLVASFLPVVAIAQSASLEEKYDIYRERFLQEFIRIDWSGDGIGEYNQDLGHYTKAGFSLPASYSFPISNAQSLWEFSHPNCQDNQQVERRPGVKKWADGTLHLGFYYTMLATEYARLKKQGRQEAADSTALELYLALQAYRRLDLMGQRIAVDWNQKNKPDCDFTPLFTGYTGFFVRDDVPRDFKKHWDVGGVISSLACRETPTDFFEEEGTRNVVSHDQIAWLLMGISCIKHAFPNDSIHVGDRSFHIASEARKIAYGMVRHVHDQPLRGIRFPDCRKKKVQTGGDSFVYAFAMKRALDYILGKHNISSSLIDRIGWELLAEDFGVVLAKALGFAKNDNIAMYLTYCVSANMESFRDVYKMSMKASQKELYPMARTWIHGSSDNDLPESYWQRMRGLLDAAPVDGTGLDSNRPDSPWRFDNRWRSHEGDDGKKAIGNGMDYMVAYNLYWLTHLSEQTPN